MLKILDVEQGSDEWLKARLGVPTASSINKIITSSGGSSQQINDYALQLSAESLVDELEPSYKSPDMVRGNELEPEARCLYQESTFSLVVERGFFLKIRADGPGGSLVKCGYSPDGLVGDDGVIEIKSPGQKNHAKYLRDGKVPTEYITQIQMGLYVSGRQWCDFVSYNPSFSEGYKLFVVRVGRDEDLIKKIKEGIYKVHELKNEYLQKIELQRESR